MFFKPLTTLAGFFLGLTLYSQTFNSEVDQPVPDDGQVYEFDLEVSGLPTGIDLTFGLERVCIYFDHTYDEDIQISLQSPEGTLIDLSSNNGGGGQNYHNTCFTENAWLGIQQGGAPFDGDYNPEGNLNDINNGQDPNGTWKLIFFDTYFFLDNGFLYDWSLTFSDEVINPQPNPFAFENSNLPLVYIDTEGQGIPDEPGVSAWMQVIDNGEGNLNFQDDPFTYEGWIDIEVRGQSTQSFPKKSYGFEMRDENNEEIDTTMLGFPSEEDWILYAPYSEKSLLQNWLSMSLSRAMGGYHSRVRYCEVFLNGNYEGIYLLMEKIKRGEDRVDIARLETDENEGDDLTGGYIWRIDWGGDTGWNSDFPIPADPNNFPYYQFVYPNPDSVTVQQQDYLEAYVDSFEYALASPDFTFAGKRYDEYIDLRTFVDNFIMNEISKNVDGYRLSSYFHKDKNSNDPRLKAGPFWDFNLSFGNADYCDGADTDDWMYLACGNSGPFWWPAFMSDQVFLDALYCRWSELRDDLLSEENLHDMIDSMAIHLSTATDRNFERWPVLGVYVWPNAQTPDTYAEAIEQMKDWISERLEWMDDEITGNPLCVPTLVNNSPNIQTFEDAYFPPLCWVASEEGNTTSGWQGATPVLGYQGGHAAFSNSFISDEFDHYLITPSLTPQQGEHLTYYVSTSSLGEEHFQVLLSTGGTEFSDFDVVLWDEEITGEEWKYRAVDLESWWGQEIHLAFRHFDSPEGFQLRIDDVRIPSYTNANDDCFVSVNEVPSSRQYALYPNPSDERVALIGMKFQPTSLVIRDASGRIISQLAKSDFKSAKAGWEFSTDHLPAGMYFICFSDDDTPVTLPLVVK